MEHKHAKAYSNILKLLPKSSVVNFQNPVYSPSRDKRSDHHHHHQMMNKHKALMGKGFSGTMMSMPLVPAGARRNNNDNNQSFANQEQEPTSPKISCMGQIKHKHKIKKLDKAKSFAVAANKEDNNKNKNKNIVKIKHPSMLKRMFTMSKPAAAARKSFDQVDERRRSVAADMAAPVLSQMKKFASGRETFTSFDWTAAHHGHQVAPETDRGNYCSYEVRENYHSDEDEDEDEFIIPFSAPIAVVKGVDLQPRKEVNLWKRRTMNPPAPLQLLIN